MSYSCCDFYDDVCAAADVDFDKIPEGDAGIAAASVACTDKLAALERDNATLRAALRRLRDCPDVQMDSTEPETDAAREQATALLARLDAGRDTDPPTAGAVDALADVIDCYEQAIEGAIFDPDCPSEWNSEERKSATARVEAARAALAGVPS